MGAVLKECVCVVGGGQEMTFIAQLENPFSQSQLSQSWYWYTSVEYLEKKPCLQAPCRLFTVVLLLYYIPIIITVENKKPT